MREDKKGVLLMKYTTLGSTGLIVSRFALAR